MPEPAPTNDLERLLKLAVQDARAGHAARARALLHALVREHPSAVKPRLLLAALAERRDEQRQLLEQVLALDPDNEPARKGLARLGVAVSAQTLPSAATTPAALPAEPSAVVASTSMVAPTPVAAPTPAESESPSRRGVGSLWLFGGALLVLLLALGLLAQRWMSESSQPTVAVNRPLPTVLLNATAAVPVIAATTVPAATVLPASPTALPQPTMVPTPPVLPMGAFREQDQWRAVLLQPDQAVVLDGSLGELSPRGRFVLALLSVSNLAAAPRRIPADMVMLLDGQGRNYRPIPNASSRYLSLYGRGSFGDLALEDEIPPGNRVSSVPLLFDIPPDATNLLLVMGSPTAGGWPVADARQSGAAPTPVATPNAAP
ncbi:MAG: DUF4352 domain-containing protein [Chloroflexaceae bacterium]|nr:DUF4352 domain-containing protein [Chloroflexaceae bacterium]